MTRSWFFKAKTTSTRANGLRQQTCGPLARHRIAADGARVGLDLVGNLFRRASARTPMPANEMAAKLGSVSGTGTWSGDEKRRGEMMGESPSPRRRGPD